MIIPGPANEPNNRYGSRRFDRTQATSGIPRGTDILRIDGHVSKVPKNRHRQRRYLRNIVRPMIININSWPGVGELSVAELLQRRIGGRLLDNHAIYNVAFGLCEFGSPEFFETVRAVRRVAFNQASKIPASTPIILTSAYANTPFGRENWAAIRAMADARSTPLCNVVLDCAIEENIRRLVSPQRARLRKLAEPQTLVAMRNKGELIDDEGDHRLRFDVTELSAEQSSNRISEWLKERGLIQQE